MNVVSAPDFTDYFALLRRYQKRGRLPPDLPHFLMMESSRGCWWGEKHHCTFCGLNGIGMEFRNKPAGRVYGELRDLKETWQVERIHVADNILPMSFLKELLPDLAQWKERPKLFYEVKANLRDDQLTVMLNGGIDVIQPGIESLSTHVLKLMRKGITGAQNLALLRSCRAQGMRVGWNFLYGFPGEELADYEAILALLPRIQHLEAPTGLNGLIIDRFSPYHANYKDFGIKRIEPYPNYRGLYPKDAPLHDIAYHFAGRYSTPLLKHPTMLTAMEKAVSQWKLRWHTSDPPRLQAVDTGRAEIVVIDTRTVNAPTMSAITRAQAATLHYFDRPRKRGDMVTEHHAHVPELLARGLLVEHEETLLNLVTGRQRDYALPSADVFGGDEPALQAAE